MHYFPLLKQTKYDILANRIGKSLLGKENAR